MRFGMELCQEPAPLLFRFDVDRREVETDALANLRNVKLGAVAYFETERERCILRSQASAPFQLISIFVEGEKHAGAAADLNQAQRLACQFRDIREQRHDSLTALHCRHLDFAGLGEMQNLGP